MTMTTTMTTPTFPTVSGLPEPRRGSHWRWASPAPRHRHNRQCRVLAVTRAIARHRDQLAP